MQTQNLWLAYSESVQTLTDRGGDNISFMDMVADTQKLWTDTNHPVYFKLLLGEQASEISEIMEPMPALISYSIPNCSLL